MVEPSTETTIGEGRAYLNSQLERGKAAKCPCCTQTVKLYRRKIIDSSAGGLIDLYRLDKQQPNYYHRHELKSLTNKGGEFATLKFWGIIEQMPKGKEITAKRTTGYWKITELGKAFVEKRIQLPRYVEVYNNRALRFSGDKIDVEESLGTRFNYRDLMEGR